MGLAVGITFLSCLQAKIEVYSVMKATILDLSLSVKSYNILGSSIRKVDQKNIIWSAKFRVNVVNEPG